MWQRIAAAWRNQHGQSLLETALLVPAIFTVVFWVFECGWLMYTFVVLADAAHEGARYAMTHSGGDMTGTQATVKTFAGASGHDVTGITTSVTFPDGSSTPPNRVRVTVTYTFVPYLSGYIGTPTLQTYAEGRMLVP